jgi:radical SAM superfamily enzyme YgiQ (UPF0313 family)
MSKQRVLLYQPPYEPPEAGMKAIAPLALLYLAGVLEPAGYEVEIIDAQVETAPLSRLRAAAADALAVGITAMSGYQLQGALAAAEAVRAVNPRLPLIWGGWHPSLRPEETACDSLVDVLVRGPGESILLELLERITAGQDWTGVRGITYRRGNEVIHEPDRPFEGLRPQRRLPFQKLRMGRYGGRIVCGDDWGANFSWVSGPPFPYTSSCGCPYRCRFCAATKVYKRKWTALPVEKTLDELEELHHRYGIQTMYFIDPEFFINAERAVGIMEGMKARGLRIFWKAQVRPEHIVRLGRPRMELAYDSGCRQLEIGAESGSPAVLAMIQKDSAPEATLESAAILRDVGIIAQYNLIFGFPRETARHVGETLRMAAELKRIDPDCLLPMYYFTVHPGIPLEEEARAHGYVPPTSLREWAHHVFSYSDPVMPWIRRPRRLKDRVLRTITFYLPLAFPGDVTRGTLRHLRARMRRWPDALWLWPAHWLARLRVCLGFYACPWEWRLFHSVTR